MYIKYSKKSQFLSKFPGISVKLASKVEVDWDASRLFNPYRTSRNEDVAFHSDCQILMNRTDGKFKILYFFPKNSQNSHFFSQGNKVV